MTSDTADTEVIADGQSAGIKFDAVICRTNAGMLSAALEANQNNRTFALLITGGVKTLKSFAFAVRDLKQDQSVEHPDLAAFKSWEEVQEHAASDEGVELRPMVKIFDQYGTDAILAICMNSVEEKNAHEADVQIVTAHRSKGLEWDRVQLFPDFPMPKEDDGKLAETDVCLAYVAATRARLVADVTAIAWMREYEVA